MEQSSGGGGGRKRPQGSGGVHQRSSTSFVMSRHAVSGKDFPSVQAQLVDHQVGPHPTLINTLYRLRKLKEQLASKEQEGLSSVGGVLSLGSSLPSATTVVLVTAGVAAAVAALVALFNDEDSEDLPQDSGEPQGILDKAKSVIRDSVDKIKDFIGISEIPEDQKDSIEGQASPDAVGVPDQTPDTSQTKRKKPVRDFSSVVNSAIRLAAQRTGEKEADLRAFISIESRGDPLARNGQHIGLGQFGPAAWADVAAETKGLPKKLTGGPDDPRYNPVLNAFATAAYMKINRRRLKQKGVVEPSLAALYMAHNIGATGAATVIKKDPKKWGEKLRKNIQGQALELRQGGVDKYRENAQASMVRHFAEVNGEPEGTAGADTTPKPSAAEIPKAGTTQAGGLPDSSSRAGLPVGGGNSAPAPIVIPSVPLLNGPQQSNSSTSQPPVFLKGEKPTPQDTSRPLEHKRTPQGIGKQGASNGAAAAASTTGALQPAGPQKQPTVFFKTKTGQLVGA